MVDNQLDTLCIKTEKQVELFERLKQPPLSTVWLCVVLHLLSNDLFADGQVAFYGHFTKDKTMSVLVNSCLCSLQQKDTAITV